MATTCFYSGMTPDRFPDPVYDPKTHDDTPAQSILAGGCFWCTEAVYRRLKGVIHVEPGYSGDTADTANYETVCSHATNHAEVIRIVYDPQQISYGQLLKVFFSVAHDPTQLDRQGEDIGRQYRSAIFFASPLEREVAQRYIEQLNAASIYTASIVTTLEPFEAFYPAEAYHHDYASRNPNQPFIRAVSAPKVTQLQSWYGDKLKTE